jgi:HNH endonuclease
MRKCIECERHVRDYRTKRCRECWFKQFNPRKRFFKNIKKTRRCWLWTGAIGSHGYGEMAIHDFPHTAHRLSYEFHKGKIPKGKCVLHKCDIRRCVRPSHLWIGTKGDNAKDMVKKGRHFSPFKDHH